jgi:microcystin-dependent protein
MSWDATQPADNEAASLGASRIRTLKTDLATALTDEGIFPGPAPTTPKFRWKPPRGTTGARPAASADYIGRLYLNSTKNCIERDNGSTWDEVTANLAATVHELAEGTLASVAGVVTLDETSNAFQVTGTEAVTSITGWTTGVVRIRWASARIITHHTTDLIMQGALSRNVVAGDISYFTFTTTGKVREIGFFGALSGKETGEVFTWAGSSAPAGSLACDGSLKLDADYPRLASKIGDVHGTTSAGVNFNVPDLRGLFVRGVDGGAANDPDRAARTAPRTGASTGDAVGSLQADEFEAHTHDIGNAGGAAGTTSPTTFVYGTSGGTTGSTGGSTETRPKNVTLLYCIKF